MEDKERIVLGTIMTVTFNVLAVIFSVVAFNSLKPVWAWCITIPLCGASIVADYLVGRYYINKLNNLKK